MVHGIIFADRLDFALKDESTTSVSQYITAITSHVRGCDCRGP